MPLELKINVDVDGNAKKELVSIEQGIKSVEAAAKTTEAPIQKVTQAIGGQSNATNTLTAAQTAMLAAQLRSGKDLTQVYIPGVNAATVAKGQLADTAKRLGGEVELLSGKWRVHQQALLTQMGLMVGLNQQGNFLTRMLATAATNAGMTTTAVLTLGGAMGALGLVAAAEIKFIHAAVDAYITKSGILDQHKDSIAGVKDAWEDLLFVSGQAIVGSGANFNGWINTVGVGLRLLGVIVVDRIDEFHRLLGLIKEYATFRLTGAPSDPASGLPTPANALVNADGSPTAAGYLQRQQGRQAAILRMDQPGFGVGDAEAAQRAFDADERARNRVVRGTVGRERQRQKVEEEAWLEGLQASVAVSMLYPGQTLQQWLASREVPGGFLPMPTMLAATVGLGDTQFGTPLGPEAWGIPGMPAGQPSWFQQWTQNGPFGPGQNGQISGWGQTANFASNAYNFGQNAMGFVEATNPQNGIVSNTAGGAMAGMSMGASIGALAGGPAGAAAGAVIGLTAGAIVGMVRSWTGATGYETRERAGTDQARGMVTDLEAQFGGREGTAFLANALDGRNWNAVRDLGGTWGAEVLGKDVDFIAKNATRGLNEILEAALTTGAEFPKALAPAMEELIRMGTITSENANLLLGLPAAGVPSFAQITEAAKLLNIEIGALGPAVQQIKLNEEAEAAVEAMGILKNAGVDTGVVMQLSAGKVQELVTRSIEMGLKLPDSLKPFVADMIAAGLLVDTTGEKLLDTGRLQWADPIKEGLDELILALRELIGLMRDDLPGAARTARDGWNDAQSGLIPFPEPTPGAYLGKQPNPNTGSGGDPDPGAGYRAHSGGYLTPWRIAHSGGFGPDEFPIIAQTGEYMHRRSSVQRYGRGFMDAVNSGSYEPGRSWPREIVMKATFVTPDFKVIAEGVARETLQ